MMSWVETMLGIDERAWNEFDYAMLLLVLVFTFLASVSEEGERPVP
jgi:hypothetical protein